MYFYEQNSLLKGELLILIYDDIANVTNIVCSLNKANFDSE